MSEEEQYINSLSYPYQENSYEDFT